MNIFLSAFAPENLVSRDGFGSPIPRQPAHLHTQAESGASLRDASRVPRRRPLLYLKTAIRHRVSPEFIGSHNCVPMVFTTESHRSIANPAREKEIRRSTGDENPQLKPTGIQIATKRLPGPTNREHRELMGVNTMSLGTSYNLYCLGCCYYLRI